MPSDKFSAILLSVDKDIESHNKKASEFLSMANALLVVAALFTTLYIVPGIAERALPAFEVDLETAKHQSTEQFTEISVNSQTAPQAPTEDRKQKTESNKAVTLVFEDPSSKREVKTIEAIVKILRFARSLKVEEARLETLSKLIPLIFGGIFAGLLLTYRFHASAAKEFTLKKIEILSKIEQGGHGVASCIDTSNP